MATSDFVPPDRRPGRRFLALAAIAAAACAPPVRGGGEGDPGGDGGSGGGNGDGPTGAGGGSGGAGAGEPCQDIGATQECMPDPCKRGTQTCVKGSATLGGGTWTPCGDVKTVPGCAPPCECASPTPACEDYCKSRDGGVPEPKCPCASKLCEGMSCAGPAIQICDPKTGAFGICKHTPGKCTPGKPSCWMGKCDECSSSLDCPKGKLCDVRGLYSPNTCVDEYPVGYCSGKPPLKPSDCWFGPKNHCTTDADCADICKQNGSCKCHAHGVCVVECLVSSDCAAGNYCQTLFPTADSASYECCGKCKPLTPAETCGTLCK